MRLVVMVAAALACSAARAQTAPNPFATIALDAAYGGVAGGLVGVGVGLVQDAHLGRDVAVGAGVGVIVGALVGIVLVMQDRPRYARALDLRQPPVAPWDGLGRTDRDPVITVPAALAFGGRF
jgi:hypothetical protein